jgi:hypothetical protein
MNTDQSKKVTWTHVGIVALVIGVLVLIVFLFFKFVMVGGEWKEHTDNYMFVRDLTTNQDKVSANDLVAADGTRLSTVCSKDAINTRYGASSDDSLGGYGLTVMFKTAIGKRSLDEKVFTLLGWKHSEETTNNDRQNFAIGKCAEFEQMVAEFTGPMKLDHVEAAIVDTTNGMSPVLVKRIHGVIADAQSGIRCGKGERNFLFAYHLTVQAYQGGRSKADFCSSEEVQAAANWLAKERPQERQSSVLRGLTAAFTELAAYVANNPRTVVRIDVFTDGLENTDELSVYKDRSVVDTNNWSKMDAYFVVSGLNLAGVEIHLHPLEEPNSDILLQDKALRYLKQRLAARGAKVTVEPF